MKIAGTVLMHGYGVRGYIWAPLQSALGDRLGPVATPDFEADSIDDLLSRAKARVRRHSLECDAPVMVIGHSLGAILAAVAARDLGPDTVAAAVLLAPPFGKKANIPGPILKLMLVHHLIPPILVRHMFFSTHTPRAVRRSMFRSVVQEHPDLQAMRFEPVWFHVDWFPEPLSQRCLVVASPGDRIVPLEQSLELARVLGAQTHVMEAEPPVAHNDLFASHWIAQALADNIAAFADEV